MRNPRLLAAGVLLVSTTLALSGCGSSSNPGATAASGQTASVKIAIASPTAYVGWIPFYLAQAKGYFKDEGVSVTFDRLEGGANIGQAVASGQDTYGVTLADPMVSLAASGQDVRAVGAFLSSPGGKVVARQGIDSVEQLKGKKLGTNAKGSASYLLTVAWLARHGLTTQDVGVVPVQAGSGAIAAFTSGGVDAISIGEPIPTILAQKYKANVVLDAATPAGIKDYYGGKYPSSVLWTTAKTAKGQPDVTGKLLRAVSRAAAFLKANDAASLQKQLGPDLLGSDPQLTAGLLHDEFGPLWQTDPTISSEEIDRVVKNDVGANDRVAAAEKSGRLTASNLVDNTAAATVKPK